VTNQKKAAVQKFHVMLFDFPFVFQTKGQGRKSFVFRPKLSRFMALSEGKRPPRSLFQFSV